MLDFRPHTLKATIPAGDSYQDADGNWITPVPVQVEFDCRISPNGSGRQIRNQDGALVVYSYLIHADLDAPNLPYGLQVQVFDGEILKGEGQIKGFFRNQRNVRIWI